MDIKILGTGCPGCKTLHQTVIRVTEKMEIEANIEKIEDFQKILEYGVMSTPALVINNRVVATGRLSEKQVVGFITSAL